MIITDPTNETQVLSTQDVMEELERELAYVRSRFSSDEEAIDRYIKHQQWRGRLRKNHDIIAQEKMLTEYYLEEIGQVDVPRTLVMERVADDLGISTDTLRNTNKKLDKLGVIIYTKGETEKTKRADSSYSYHTPISVTLNYLIYTPENIKRDASERAGGARVRKCQTPGCKSEDLDRYAIEYCRECRRNHVQALPGLRGDANVYEMISSMNLEDMTDIDPKLNDYAMSSVQDDIDQPESNQKHNAFSPEDVAAMDQEVSQPELTTGSGSADAKHNAFVANTSEDAPIVTVHHIGYTEPHARETIENLLSAPDTLLIDTRLRPFSKMPEWTGEALSERYGSQYKQAGHVLGNRNYKGGEIDIVDLARGVKGLQHYLDQHQNLVLLCMCKHDQCHRYKILDALQQAEPSLVISHAKHNAFSSDISTQAQDAKQNAETTSINSGFCILPLTKTNVCDDNLPNQCHCDVKTTARMVSYDHKRDGYWCRKCDKPWSISSK